MRAIYDRAQPRRPGMIAMDDAWWEWLFFEKESEKDEPTFYAVHETDGEPDAYATYRVKHEWPDSIPKLELTVRQLVAATPDAYADIWRYLFDVDLVHRVKAWNRPVDEPLSFLMEEPRRLRFRIADGLRVRLVDVPAALEARGFVGRRPGRRRGRGSVLSLERGPVRDRGVRRGGQLLPHGRRARYRLQRDRSGRHLSGRSDVPAAPSGRSRRRGPRRGARARRRDVRLGSRAVEPVHLLVRDGRARPVRTRGSPARRTRCRSRPGRRRARPGSTGDRGRRPASARRSPAA